MPEVRFAKFCHSKVEGRVRADWKCAAILSSGQDCGMRILPSTETLRALHMKLEKDFNLSIADRAHTLERIAGIILCAIHNEDKNVLLAAVKQWESEIVTQANPQTPKRSTNQQQGTIIFSPYTSPDSKTKPRDSIQIDHSVIDALTKEYKNDTLEDHLYVFSHKSAPGHYKVGKAKELSRVTEFWDKTLCCSGLELHTFLKCPNARRFERVFQAEYLPYRRIHVCDTCKSPNGRHTTHTEWFEAPLEMILEGVQAWCLYSLMREQYRLHVDGCHQILPDPGKSQRSDRWRSWALDEANRWKQGSPEPVNIPPKVPIPEKPHDTTDACESDSEHGSIFSSPADPIDTPGTTPGSSTPGSWPGEVDDDELPSPTPAERYITEIPAKEIDDKDDLQLGASQPLERALFKQVQPRSPPEQSLFNKSETNSQPIEGDEPAPPAKDLMPHPNPDPVESLLRRNKHLVENKGTIYLTRLHPDRGPYKLYHRKDRKARKLDKECYSIPDEDFQIQCTNTIGIEALVLAEFSDRKADNQHCRRPGCTTAHRNWIEASREEIEASLRAWTEFVGVGFSYSADALKGRSQGPDRWTKWAQEMVAKKHEADARRQEEKGMQVPGEHSSCKDGGDSTKEPRKPSRSWTGGSMKSIAETGRRLTGNLQRASANRNKSPGSGSEGSSSDSWAKWLRKWKPWG
ncbi:hypothetical protein BJX64DRAFT_272971 [Aspergillus heterothallicus]